MVNIQINVEGLVWLLLFYIHVILDVNKDELDWVQFDFIKNERGILVKLEPRGDYSEWTDEQRQEIPIK
ncbi:hypothetical protein H8E77_39345 [bacterium]|nr:hypothetical protein [bacterium]